MTQEPEITAPELQAGLDIHFLVDWGHKAHAQDRDRFSSYERDLLARLESLKQ